MATSLAYCLLCDTFVDLFIQMITTTDILHFAKTHKVFTRKELIANLKSQAPVNPLNTLSEQINRLLKSNQIVRLDRGVYALSDNTKKEYSIVCSDDIKRIYQQIKTQFPFANYCIWDSNSIMPYMHHIPNLNFIYVDVERDATESVFNLLNSDRSQRVFLMPDQTQHERYITGSEAIIIRPLVSEAPLQTIEGMKTPTIEKILVDIIGDIEFSFLQGNEMNAVYTNIFERNNVNKSKLLRYATRRGRKQEVEQLLQNNKL